MDDTDFIVITKQEYALHRADVRSDPARVAALLVEGFIEFGRSGTVYDRDGILKALADESETGPPAEISVDDVNFRRLSTDTVLMTYRSRRTTIDGERFSLRSSIWVKQDGEWRMAFHQGTPVDPP